MNEFSFGPIIDLAGQVIEKCSRTGQTIATCESITGGLIAAALTSIPGASVVMRGGLVTYATEVKHTLAGIDFEVLDAGVVSEATALAMAWAACKKCQADIGVATTGVAGPGPQEGIAAGTVWLAMVNSIQKTRLLLPLADEVPSRSTVRQRAVIAILEMLLFDEQ